MHSRYTRAVIGSCLLAGFATVSSAEPMKELMVYQSGLGKWACDAKETGSGKAVKAVVEKTA